MTPGTTHARLIRPDVGPQTKAAASPTFRNIGRACFKRIVVFLSFAGHFLLLGKI